MKKKTELILPAGNYQKLKYAFLYGADACYFGLPDFSIRNRSTNFNLKTLKKAIEYSHSLGKKCYITINTYPHNQEFKKLGQYLQELKKFPPDAVIISDAGVLNLVKKYLPQVNIHLSTQANTVNYESVIFWQKNGIKRIILARELSLKEIKEIRKKCPRIELEIFIHGSMCIAYSGRCLLSLYMTGRDANRGECAQPCRWKYSSYFLEEKLRPNEFWPIEENKQGTYILNSKDLCLIDYLPQLFKIGLDGFKIEGRAKSIYYLALVTKIYREAIDLLYNSKIKEYHQKLPKFHQELETIHNRGYTSGFITGQLKNLQNYNSSRPQSCWQFCGEIIKYNRKTKEVVILVHNRILPQTEIEFITPNSQFKIKIKIKKLINIKNEIIKSAHAGYLIKEKVPFELLPGTIIRQKIN